MRNSYSLIRSLVSSVILEGFRDDQARLSELYPEHAGDINSLQPKWIAWLTSRFGDSPKIKETHPFGDAIVTVLNFTKKDSALFAKYRDSEQFRAAVDAQFPPEKRQWQSPNDVTSMTVDEMETILSLSERKKQRFDVDKGDKGFEGDRVGKVGSWNLWMPTTRENSCNIVGSDPVTLEPKTTWCTARTSGSNLFYSYVGRTGEEITLFYVIRDDPKIDRDWLSVGFVNGVPVLDGKMGGVSVDRANNGLTHSSLRSALGSDYSEIMAILTQKNKALGGKHPARQKIADAAKSTKALEYLTKGLSKEEASDLKMMVVKEPDLSVEVALLLSGDDDWDVRSNIAKNANSHPEALSRLASDEDRPIRSSVAGNKNTPAEVLARLASDKDAIVRAIVAGNKNTPAEVLSRLASDKDRGVRVNVAKNTSTPPEILIRLSSDDDHFVRRGVADNANTPADVLTRLASDENADVRLQVAMNTSTPPESLTRLASDGDELIRRYVSGNKSTPADALTILASDKNEDVRVFVAFSKSTPPEALVRLANDKVKKVRMHVASNTNAPPEALAILASDVYYEVRLSVTLNKSTPPELLNKLARDIDKGVRAGAYKNPSTTIETLRNAAQERSTFLGEWEGLMNIIRQREATNESLLRNLIRKII
jgi:hypothetical protein